MSLLQCSIGLRHEHHQTIAAPAVRGASGLKIDPTVVTLGAQRVSSPATVRESGRNEGDALGCNGHPGAGVPAFF
jgi:hypothetical protein